MYHAEGRRNQVINLMKRLLNGWSKPPQAPRTKPLSQYTEPQPPDVMAPDKQQLAQELEQRQRSLRQRLYALEAQAEVETRRHQK
jgi:hypothetical protein